KCILGNSKSVASSIGKGHRVYGGINGLDCVSCLAEMGSLGTYITNFHDPILGKLVLDAQIPLLGTGRNEVPRNLEAEEINHVAVEVWRAQSYVGQAAIVETKEVRKRGNEVGIDHPAHR